MVGTVLFGGGWTPSASPRRRPCARWWCALLLWRYLILALMSYSLDLDGEPAPSHTSKAARRLAPPSRPAVSPRCAPLAVGMGRAVCGLWLGRHRRFRADDSFWIIGQLDDDPQVLGRFTGIYRCLQSGGAAVSWVLSTLSWDCGGRCAGPVPPTAQAWINIIVGMASLPGTIWLAMTLDERPHEKALSASVFTAPDRADGLLRAAEPDEADRCLVLPPQSAGG